MPISPVIIIITNDLLSLPTGNETAISSALSSLSSLRENRRKALIAKIMTRFELLVSQISGLYISNMIHGRCTITEGSGGLGGVYIGGGIPGARRGFLASDWLLELYSAKFQPPDWSNSILSSDWPKLAYFL